MVEHRTITVKNKKCRIRVANIQCVYLIVLSYSFFQAPPIPLLVSLLHFLSVSFTLIFHQYRSEQLSSHSMYMYSANLDRFRKNQMCVTAVTPEHLPLTGPYLHQLFVGRLHRQGPYHIWLCPRSTGSSLYDKRGLKEVGHTLVVMVCILPIFNSWWHHFGIVIFDA